MWGCEGCTTDGCSGWGVLTGKVSLFYLNTDVMSSNFAQSLPKTNQIFPLWLPCDSLLKFASFRYKPSVMVRNHSYNVILEGE